MDKGSRRVIEGQSDEIKEIQSGTLTRRLLGIINYKDNSETVRATSFFRIYNSGLVRFVKAEEGHPENDREYEN
jgi:hypothetical protein